MCETLCPDCLALGYCRKDGPPVGRYVCELKFYNEHPDQALENLDLLPRIEYLRETLRGYMASRDASPKASVAEIIKRPNDWARKEYQKRISKTFNEANLRDFLRGRSKLVKESRLLVHVYVWTTLQVYRDEWGAFYEHGPDEEG